MNKLVAQLVIPTTLACSFSLHAVAQGTYLRAPDNNPTNALGVLPGGGVLIGNAISDPNAKLTLGGATARLSLHGTRESEIAWFRRDPPNQVPRWLFSVRPDIGGDNDDLKLFHYGNGNFSGIAIQVQTDTGNVGIGTIAPQSKLHVAGGARFGAFSVSEPVANWPYGYESIALTQTGLNFRHYALGSIVFHAAGNNGGQMAIHGDQVAIGTRLNVASKVSCATLELTSDRNQKQNFRPISAPEILAKVLQLPVSTWAYTNSPGVRHLGPMAQDFKAAFNLGEDNKHIGAGDGIGVALTAIQGLNEKVEARNTEIVALKDKNSRLEARVVALEQRLSATVAVLERMGEKLP